MARPTTGYFGTDTPENAPRRPAGRAPAPPAPGVGELLEEPRLGDGGGADPRVPVEGAEPTEGMGPNPADPYGIAGGQGYDDGLGAGPIDAESANRELYQWLQQQLGITEEQAGDMTMREIQELIGKRAPGDQALRDTLGTVQADMGMVPEDPGIGPGDMRFMPGGR